MKMYFYPDEDKVEKIHKYTKDNGLSISGVTKKLWNAELLQEDFKNDPEVKMSNIKKHIRSKRK